MKKYIFRRLLYGIVSVWLVSVIIFIATRVGPDPALMVAPPGATQEELREVHQRFGLDKPLPIQYLIFISGALKGDFGESVYYGIPVSQIILQRLPATALLVGASQFIAITIGILAGGLAARNVGGWLDNSVRWFSLVGISMPNFLSGMIFILIFSVSFRLFPSGGYGGIQNLIMPAFALGWYHSAANTRMAYSSLLQVLNSEYIKLARVKGLSEFSVVGKHALKPALIPIVTLAGLSIVRTISGAVAVETVFSWPGLGLLMYEGATSRDFNIVQGVVIIVSVMMVLVNLMVDILYAYLDPRIRYE